MPKVKILPHPEICPEGAEFVLDDDESLCEGALRNGLKIEHACELSCACTPCHCIVREGYESLEEPSETEESDYSSFKDDNLNIIKKINYYKNKIKGLERLIQ